MNEKNTLFNGGLVLMRSSNSFKHKQIIMQNIKMKSVKFYSHSVQVYFVH